MKTIKATVTETILIQKVVTLTVDEDLDEFEIQDLARDKACKETLQENNGWELADSEGIEITLETVTRDKPRWHYAPTHKGGRLMVPLSDGTWVEPTEAEAEAFHETERFIQADHRQRTLGRMDR